MNARSVCTGALVAALCGCGGGGGSARALEGSLSEQMSLAYERAVLELGDGAWAVRFVRAQGGGEDTVLQVTTSTIGLELAPGRAIDLAEPAPEAEAEQAQRGVVSRNVLDDPRREFPRLTRGRLVVNALPAPQTRVGGELSITFENGTEYASGRTVFGAFSAEVP